MLITFKNLKYKRSNDRLLSVCPTTRPRMGAMLTNTTLHHNDTIIPHMPCSLNSFEFKVQYVSLTDQNNQTYA